MAGFESVEKGTASGVDGWLTREKTETQTERERLLALLRAVINDSKEQLHLADSSKLVSTVEQEASKSAQEKARAELGTSIPGLDNKLEAEIAKEQTKSSKTATTEESKRSKIDYLHRKILDYQQIFAALSEMTASDSYLFLTTFTISSAQIRLAFSTIFTESLKGSTFGLKSAPSSTD